MALTRQPGVILLVEDAIIRRYLKRLLGDDGRTAVEANVETAIRLLRQGDMPVDLLITNQPAEFLEFAEFQRILYLAAFPDWDLAARFSKIRVLQKPFRIADLRNALDEAAARKATEA